MNRLLRPGPPPVELSGVVSGAGARALVLLHGFPFDATMWRPQLRDLEGRARVVAPDLRGLGRSGLSGDAEEDGSLQVHAQDVLAWMDSARIERAAVAGLSMGGYLAFELWRRAPERITALGLFDTKAEPDSEEARRGRDATSETIAKGGMAAVADGMIARVLGPTTRAKRSGVVEHVRRMILDTKPEGARAALQVLKSRPSSVSDLRGITVPAIVLVGNEDELTPVAASEAMVAAMPRAELRVVKGAGHVTSLESPAEVARALEDLLERAENGGKS